MAGYFAELFPNRTAFQAAVANGFPGTEQEWLASLQGNDVSIQYSSDGESWSADTNVDDIYIRFSTDGGTTWSNPSRFRGMDGAAGSQGPQGPAGADGAAGSAPQFRYSVDGVDWYPSPVDALYIQFSTDGGATWSAAARFKGEDGADGSGGGAEPITALTFANPLVADMEGGAFRDTAATSDFELDPPTNPTKGDRLELWITASGAARNMTVDAAIVVPSDSGFTSPKALASGKTYIVMLKYSGSAWWLVSLAGGY